MKKFKLLSSLLAVLVVLTCMSGISVCAVQTSANAFFCDFEDFTTGANTASAFTDEGFKWMTVGNAVIGEDATYGKILTSEKIYNLGASFANPVTTGKVRLSFSARGGSLGYVYFAGVMGTSNKAADGTAETYTIAAPGQYGINLFKAGSSTEADVVSWNVGQWYHFDIVVDIDANSWSTYIDGVLGASARTLTADGDTDPIPRIQGVYFANAGDRAPDIAGAIDNVALSYEAPGEDKMQVLSSKVTEGTDADVIRVGFSEELVDGITASDVTITECGTSTTIGISSVNVVDNQMTITCASTLAEAKEYVITFGANVKSASGKAVKGEAYAYLPSDSATTVEVTTYTELKDFEDLETITENYTNAAGEPKTAEGVSNAYAKNILRYVNYYANPADSTCTARAVKTAVNESDKGNTQASGSALGSNVWAKVRLLDIIPTDVGVETYEFDFVYTDATGTKLVLKHTNGASTSTGTITDVMEGISKSNTWKHMKIDYDTINDTISVYIDGSLNKKTTGITAFDHPLFYSNNASSPYLAIDNYTSYVTVTTTELSLEKVRYVDAFGNVTGANTISPETTQIEITFSEAMDDSTIDDITLSKGVITSRDLSDDGCVVILGVAGMLPGGTPVTLTVPTSVASEAGNTLKSERVYNVITLAGKYEISNLALTVNGSEIAQEGTTAAAGDTVVVTADVVNTKAVGKIVAVVYAFYNDDQLVDIQARNVEITNTEYTKAISESFTTKANTSYDKVKAFIWDGLTTAVPQTEAPSYPVEQ